MWEIKERIECTDYIFVTSRNTCEDELLSIQSGGVDFIKKPYHKSILLEKIKRALHMNNPINFKEITRKGYTLDLHLSILKYQDKEIELTRNEFRILYYFFLEGNRVITKEKLLEYLWNDTYYLDESILMVNINRLRKKAKEIGIHDLDYVVYTDEKWITFVISQIVQNSLKYLDKPDKTIEIYGEENKHNVILSIQDNGCSIKKSDLAMVFEKGFTGDNRRKKYSTGMGLYLARKLCIQLGLKL